MQEKNKEFLNMAHFAKIDENNIVQEVLVFDLPDDGLPLIELPEGWRWLRTSYNNNIRKNFAGQGYTYDETRDAFIPTKGYDSWELNEETCRWEAPKPYPAEALGDPDQLHMWDESKLEWVHHSEHPSMKMV